MRGKARLSLIMSVLVLALAACGGSTTTQESPPLTDCCTHRDIGRNERNDPADG